MPSQDELRERSLEVMEKLVAGGVRGEAMPARDIAPEFFELAIHLQGALNLGVSQAELSEVLMQTSQYAGIPVAVQALNTAADVFRAE